MKVVIVFGEEKLLLDSMQDIKVKEVFKLFRSKYSIDKEKKLILVGEEETFEENDLKEEELINSDSNFSKSQGEKKFNYYLFASDNYDEPKTEEFYTPTDHLIMQVTGAKELLEKRNSGMPPLSRRFEFRRENSEFFRRDIIGDIIFDRSEDLEDPSEGEVSILERAGIINNRGNFLGRMRARESSVNSRALQDYLRRGRNIPNSSGESEGNQPSDRARADPQPSLIFGRNDIVNLNNAFDEFEENTNSSLNSWSVNPFQFRTSAPRAEDIRRLVNEMGFDENRVRIALRVARNNVTRAVDLLINGPEELFLQILDSENPRSREQNAGIEQNSRSNAAPQNLQVEESNLEINPSNENIRSLSRENDINSLIEDVIYQPLDNIEDPQLEEEISEEFLLNPEDSNSESDEDDFLL